MRYQRSAEWLAYARQVTPGASQTRSRSQEHFPEGSFPAFLDAGNGCYVWDRDGNKYIDWIMGLASVTLGYAHPAITKALDAATGRIGLSLPTTLEARLAERLCQVIPCAESVRFVKTGSEATEAAMRIARVETGRDKIVSIGYHGWHSVHDAAKREHPGVPAALTSTIYDMPYNVLPVLDETPYAAVIIEPTLIEPPFDGYLQEIRDRCTKTGTVLIFDEIVTGYRWALGGGQEYFNVKPDLACFGKAMGNGVPIACVVGGRDLMKHAWYVSSTSGGDALGLAAASAVLDVYETEDVVTRLWQVGTLFQAGFKQIARAGFGIEGYPVHPKIVSHSRGREGLMLFLQETASRGVLFHGAGFNTSIAHTDADVHYTLEVCNEAFEAIDKGAVLKGTVAPERFKRA